MDAQQLWSRFQQFTCDCPSVGLSLDYSRMNFSDSFLDSMKEPLAAAFKSMDELEGGAIANPDEKRMVGHYWLRDTALAPSADIKKTVETTNKNILKFAKLVHTGKIKPPKAPKYKHILVVGIGGSALGPQFVSKALGNADDPIRSFFFDNTDPDGMDNVVAQIEAAGNGLKETLCIVISKSGGTKETRNGMLEAKAAYEKAKLNFSAQAVAVTGEGSELFNYAKQNQWLAIFPMWDWVGGRTSELSAVGLLPAALQGLNINGMLKGAKAMDAVTRVKDPAKNPAAILAAMWYHAGNGKGAKDMVILPYKDRLELFSKYLQQLVMESLGKEKDLKGNVVHQGIAVYGNKGSTDQHAYVQQLRDGVNNFFITFIEVLKDRGAASMDVEPGVTTGDYLSGFLQGSRKALFENGRESMTLTVKEVNAETVGKLIALYERAVGFYASLVGINAYHQPGVEAGKKAATQVITLQKKAADYLKANKGKFFTAEALASALNEKDSVETLYWILRHLSANSGKRIKVKAGKTPFDTQYGS